MNAIKDFLWQTLVWFSSLAGAFIAGVAANELKTTKQELKDAKADNKIANAASKHGSELIDGL